MKFSSPGAPSLAVSTVFVLLAGCGDGSGGGPGVGDGGAGGVPDQAMAAKVYPPASAGGSPEDGLARLNEYRKLMDLAPVKGDNSGQYACEGHLDYLIWEAKKAGVPCYLRHDEPNRQNPFYSVANDAAGKNSVIACGSGGYSLSKAVDTWINSLYHRLPLIDNGLEVVGYAAKDGLACINYRPGTHAARTPKPILWPAHGMTDVPTQFGGNEGPCPTNPANPLGGGRCDSSGFIVTASWFGWGTFDNADPVELTEVESGNPVELLVWYGDGVIGHDPIRGYVPSTIALVPSSPLMGKTQYRLKINADIGGKSQAIDTVFTTGFRND